MPRWPCAPITDLRVKLSSVVGVQVSVGRRLIVDVVAHLRCQDVIGIRDPRWNTSVEKIWPDAEEENSASSTVLV